MTECNPSSSHSYPIVIHRTCLNILWLAIALAASFAVGRFKLRIVQALKTQSVKGIVRAQYTQNLLVMAFGPSQSSNCLRLCSHPIIQIFGLHFQVPNFLFEFNDWIIDE